MSEKQARQKRKNEPQKEEIKQKGSALFGWITAIIILAFLGLGGYALKDNIKALLPQRPQKEATVAELAKERNISVDEFLAEYGLTDSGLNKKSTGSEVVSKLTVANYAKYTEQTAEELLETYDIKGADENMLWQDAYKLMPMSRYAETMGVTFDELKEQAGLPDQITEKTTLGEAEEIMEKAQETEENTAEKAAE